MKAADSPWKCNDRGNAWLKIKPDYLQVRMTASLQNMIRPQEALERSGAVHNNV